MRKEGGRLKSTKRRYFVLTGSTMFYFREEASGGRWRRCVVATHDEARPPHHLTTAPDPLACATPQGDTTPTGVLSLDCSDLVVELKPRKHPAAFELSSASGVDLQSAKQASLSTYVAYVAVLPLCRR